MDEHEQKMYEAIKELTGSEVEVQRIEGFEPSWWSNSPHPTPTQTSVTRNTRERSALGHKNTEVSPSKSRIEEARAVCGKNSRPFSP